MASVVFTQLASAPCSGSHSLPAFSLEKHSLPAPCPISAIGPNSLTPGTHRWPKVTWWELYLGFSLELWGAGWALSAGRAKLEAISLELFQAMLLPREWSQLLENEASPEESQPEKPALRGSATDDWLISLEQLDPAQPEARHLPGISKCVSQ